MKNGKNNIKIDFDAAKNISAEDKVILLEYYNKILSRQVKYYGQKLFSFARLYGFIEEGGRDYIPLRDWDRDILEQFINVCLYTQHNTDITLDMLSEIFALANNPISTDVIDVSQIIKDQFIGTTVFSADEMDMLISDCHKYLYGYDFTTTITAHASIIAIFYLSWLGFSSKEISYIRRDDYNDACATISFDDKIVSFAEYGTMRHFLREYNNATTYKIWGGEKTGTYKCFDYFIKDIKDGYNKAKMTSIYNWYFKDFNNRKLMPSNLLRSGYHNKLFKAEANGFVVNNEHAEAIVELLGLKNTANKRSAGLLITRLIEDYQNIYKPEKIKQLCLY